jgi:hypothetical protein
MSKTPATVAPAVKSAIQSASGHVQYTAVKAEQNALAAVAQVEGAMASLKTSFDGVTAVGANVVEVVDTAGRTALSGAVAVNGSLMNYGKDLVADTIELGRKTIETRSLTDAVALHTAFAERRIQAAFQTAAAINTLNQNNVMAMWAPLASLVRSAGGSVDATLKSAENATLKTAA